ncbi:MAG: hypothetical protein MUD01_25005 [Chloroflexaceae bacterium]|jgi:hypothetical protein|nr:hypothetical protein [Chloroflexaceae bacterium]
MAGLLHHMAFLTHTVFQQIPDTGDFTLTVSGIVILVFLVLLGGYIGYENGIRAMLTVALGTIIAYLVGVRGGEIVSSTINRFWSNGQRIVGFATGNPNWQQIPATGPLIPPDLSFEPVVRGFLFIAIVVIAIVVNSRFPWYSASPAGYEKWAKPLGALTGGLITLLWTSAAVVFYGLYVAAGNELFNPLNQLLRVIPDLDVINLWAIALFVLVLLWVMVVKTPRIFMVPPPPAKK